MSMQEVIDPDRIGRRGFPRHYQAFGIEPPMKTVQVDDQGQPEAGHPGMTAEEQRELAISAIKVEARRRIEDAWPIWRQINLQAEGGEAFTAMRAEIDAIRTRSNEIELMDPLPADVTADDLWMEPAAE